MEENIRMQQVRVMNLKMVNKTTNKVIKLVSSNYLYENMASFNLDHMFIKEEDTLQEDLVQAN